MILPLSSARIVPDRDPSAGLAKVTVVVTADQTAAVDPKVVEQIRRGLGLRLGRGMGLGIGGGLS